MDISLDTNILVYAIDIDPNEADKQAISRELLGQALSAQTYMPTQVLGELYNVLIRKKRITRAKVADIINQWSQEFTVVSPSVEAFNQALAYAARTGTQFWDALILATCAQHGVKKLYTEDIGAQTQAMGVKLIDPFNKPVKPKATKAKK